MSRFGVFIVMLIVAASVVVIAQVPLAGAQDLFIKRSDEPNGKPKNNGELFLRGDSNGQDYPSAPSLNNSVTKKTTWKMPASWGLLDAKSKMSKIEQTEAVMKEQKATESKINKDNAKGYDDAQKKMAQETEKMKPKTPEETAAAQGQEEKDAAKKNVSGSSAKTVIKRDSGSSHGGTQLEKPKRLFNSIKD
jgi:hypothetical protein